MIIKHSTGSIDSVYDKNKKEWVKKEYKIEEQKEKEKEKPEKVDELDEREK